MAALELDIKTIKSGKSVSFTIQIVSQRLRGGKASFAASNGFYFNSLSCPAIGACYNSGDNHNSNGMLYLRGSARSSDNDMLHTRSVGYVEKLKAAVIEYNIAKEGVS